jgi:uncharacterized protein YfdQ (DUF2303 family)
MSLTTGDGPRTEAQAIIDNAIEAVEPTMVDPQDVYSLVVPAGARHEVLDLARLLPNPRRTQGVVHLQRVQDLERYIERHDDPALTTIWVDADAQKVVAVLNDHAATAAHWGDHRAELQLKLTDAWQHWLRLDGKLVGQEDFAEHIEDGLQDIVKPDGATMLEVAQSIQGTKSAEFKGARRLQDGNIGVEWVEETTATAGQRGDLEIPERFELALAPFEGEDAYKVDARLRYRVRGGDLLLGYRLDRPGDILRDAVDTVRDRLAQRFTVDRVFVGRPR